MSSVMAHYDLACPVCGEWVMQQYQWHEDRGWLLVSWCRNSLWDARHKTKEVGHE